MNACNDSIDGLTQTIICLCVQILDTFASSDTACCDGRTTRDKKMQTTSQQPLMKQKQRQVSEEAEQHQHVH